MSQTAQLVRCTAFIRRRVPPHTKTLYWPGFLHGAKVQMRALCTTEDDQWYHMASLASLQVPSTALEHPFLALFYDILFHPLADWMPRGQSSCCTVVCLPKPLAPS